MPEQELRTKALCAGLVLGTTAAVCALKLFQRAASTQNIQGNAAVIADDGSMDELKEEIYSRVRFFFGRENFAKLQSSFVVVVGLGGVGSHAANMLVRSGVTHIRLVDFDQVTLSSLNRHSMATLQDVGTPKVEAMKRYFSKLMPWCRVEAVPQMFKGGFATELLNGQPDYVLDCIDDVVTKAELIAYCTKNNIPVITSTGAGAKADPTKIRIGKLTDCVNDPLASKIKWKLKKYNVNIDDITTVFSVEKPSCNLVPLSDEQKLAPQDFGAVDYFRLRIMPVLGTSPAIFGQSMASFVACSLAGYHIEPDCTERMSKNMRHKLLQSLRTAETRKYGTPDMVNIDDEELEFLIHQVWKNRCATTGLRIGGHAPLVLSRWNVDAPPTVSNLILTTQAEAVKLDTLGRSEAIPRDVQNYITSRLLWARSVCQDEAFGRITTIKSDGEVIIGNKKNRFSFAVALKLHWGSALIGCVFGAVTLRSMQRLAD